MRRDLGGDSHRVGHADELVLDVGGSDPVHGSVVDSVHELVQKRSEAIPLALIELDDEKAW